MSQLIIKCANACIYGRAYRWGQKWIPDAPLHHHQAFASAVHQLVTGQRLPRSGSVRENLAIFHGTAPPIEVVLSQNSKDIPDTRYTFEQACFIALKCCYGMLTPEHDALRRVQNGVMITSMISFYSPGTDNTYKRTFNLVS